MMDEEELNYAAVTFSCDGVYGLDKTDELIIYDEVKTRTDPQTTYPHIREEEGKPVSSLLLVVAAGLGIICVALVSAVISVCVHLSDVNTVMSQLQLENINLKAQNLQLWTQKNDSERWTEDLTRDRDRLNWTISFILDHDNFPVSKLCPNKVCKPCLDDWQLFQSNCYRFSTSNFSKHWKTWEESQNKCKEVGADLVVIDSQEEQEFISKHIKSYNDDKHGYWIGLKKDDTWTWVDGSNVTVTYWTNGRIGNIPCALSQPRAEPLRNWQTASCTMKNRWICETRALLTPD